MKTQETSLSNQKQASGNSEPKSKRRISAIPKLRHHKATGQAYVVLNNKSIFFGAYGTPEATQKYHQTIAEWLAAGRLSQSPQEISINEVIARFWVYAQGYTHWD